MSDVGAMGWLFIAYMLVLFPMGAIRTARRVRVARESGGAVPLPSRTRLYLSTLVVQASLGLMAYAVSRQLGTSLMGTRDIASLTTIHWLYGVATLIVLCLLAELSWRTRPEAERRSMFTRLLLPQSPRERVLFGLVVLAAGTCEELAFRGALFQLLGIMTGSLLASAVLCSVDFALVHYPQGRRSMVTIFFMALLKHSLVMLTGTLLVSMVVHVAYDLVATWRTARRFATAA